MIKGKGYYIHKVWDLASDTQTLVTRAKEAGLGHVLIKISDNDKNYPLPSGDSDASQEQFTHDAIAAFKSSGITVAGWAFVYGSPAEPAAQARQFAARLQEFDLSFGVINAENIRLSGTRYNWKAADAKIFVETMLAELNRLGIADTILALSSYRFMSVHGSFPFKEFMAGCQVAMPQVYWVQSDPVDDLKESMRQYEAKFPDKSFIPTGAAYGEGGWEATPQEITAFLNQVSASGITAVNFWSWRNAWNTRKLWDAVAQYPFNPSTPPPNGGTDIPVVPSDVNIEDDGEAVIRINAEGYADGLYPNSSDSLTLFQRNEILFKWTHTRKNSSTVWAQWFANIPKSGRYFLEAYIPGEHGTTRYARYHVHGVVGADPIAVVEVNQLKVYDTYTPIGVFELDASHPDCGKVALNNFIKNSQEPEAKELAFGPIRWTQLVDVPEGEADGFDAPVGTEEERTTDQIWPGDWASKLDGEETYLRRQPVQDGGPLYFHTGVDLNRPQNLDKEAEVYSIGDGEIIFSGHVRGFGNLIVIEHEPYREGDDSITRAYSRYGHLKERLVLEKVKVRRGEQIGTIGKADLPSEQLHFDVSTTDLLKRNPNHWPHPSDSRDAVAFDYLDPAEFIRQRRPGTRPPRIKRIRGVNINLDLDTTSPPDLTPLAYCRFVYDLSQERGNLDFNVVRAKYDAKIRRYIDQNVTPVAVLNHEFYGEGQGFNWDILRADNASTQAQWARLSDKLAEFAAIVAREYGDKMVYQIWNEADQASVAAVYVPPRSLADMTDKCLDAILAVAPDAKVISSGLVSGDTRYWQKVEVAMKHADRLAGVALHTYGRGPRGRPARYQIFGKTKDLLDAYARITNHKFWITEWGVTGDPSRSEPPNESPENVAAYITEFLLDVERDPRIEAALYFAYADRMHNTYGLSLHTGERKPKVWGAIATV